MAYRLLYFTTFSEVVEIGGAIHMQSSKHSTLRPETFSSTLGMRPDQNPYLGELAAIAHALGLLPSLRFRSMVLLTSNKAAVLTLRNPH